jgi:hypothetical protein
VSSFCSKLNGSGRQFGYYQFFSSAYFSPAQSCGKKAGLNLAVQDEAASACLPFPDHSARHDKEHRSTTDQFVLGRHGPSAVSAALIDWPINI